MSGPAPINTGVCGPWTTGADVLACCDATIGSNTALADEAALIASDLLYEMSGLQYPGICEALVRPGGKDNCWVRPSAWGSIHGFPRQALIRLAGYPVREILEVQIDGDILDAADYELRRNRYLARIDGFRWPVRPVDGDDTFTVNYTYGLEPPPAGVNAVVQLACELLRAGCGGGDEDDCEFPAGTVRITRQGLTIDTQSLGLWLIGTQRTGMPLVDSFLSVYGSVRKPRRSLLFTPELDPYPLRVE